MKIGEYEVTWHQLLAVALTVLFIYLVLTRIFGHSATDFALVLAAFSTLGTWIFSLKNRFSTLNREIGEFKTSMLHFKESTEKNIEKIMRKLEIK